MNLQFYLTPIIILCTALLLHAQAPQAFNYTSFAIDSKGKEVSNQQISLLASILQNDPNGTLVYSESHQVVTDNKGLFSIPVGRGLAETGSFGSVEWGSGPMYLSIAIDADGGSNYITTGTIELLSVPYALQSGASGSDASDENEIITGVTIEGNVIYLAEGENEAEIDLAPVLDALPDNDPENELQLLIMSDGMLSISNGNSVILPGGGGGSYYYYDGDEDTFGDPSRPVWVPENIPAPEGFVAESGDANDSDPTVYPGSDPVDLCEDDDAGSICAAATNLGSFFPGQIKSANGVLKEESPIDWYSISNPTIDDDQDTFKVELKDESGGSDTFKMDIFNSCGNEPISTGVTSFSDAGLAANPSKIYVKIYRPDGDYSVCENYILKISR